MVPPAASVSLLAQSSAAGECLEAELGEAIARPNGQSPARWPDGWRMDGWRMDGWKGGGKDGWMGKLLDGRCIDAWMYGSLN